LDLIAVTAGESAGADFAEVAFGLATLDKALVLGIEADGSPCGFCKVMISFLRGISTINDIRPGEFTFRMERLPLNPSRP
jgi:hypothetical protein